MIMINPREYCGAWWMVDGFGRETQRALCMLKPDHHRGNQVIDSSADLSHRATVLDSDDNPISVTPAGGAEIFTLHMVTTHPSFHPFFRGRVESAFEAVCRCTWLAYAPDEVEARRIGDDHLRTFNGLQTEGGDDHDIQGVHPGERRAST